ncbi:MAG TPA: DNA-3-methyladenine glycosylase I [Candidatus Cloacimonadota bacterium]|nr:DNA-3-methyladenine glycosylase I [Candidatus Cloacimonadota bacterium]
MKELSRCEWVGKDPLMIKYHDEEWGVPVHDDRKLFEFMVLDAFQAGLSWSCVLGKRENFRVAMDNFEAGQIALYNEEKIAELLENAGIIRNKSKIRATIVNARLFLQIQREFGSFDRYIWQFTKGKTIQNRRKLESEIPSRSVESDAMSEDLRKRGFKFVGSTICYAFMQAAGMVNDHLTSCFRY